MSMVFNPSGALDVSTDSTDLPEQILGPSTVMSTAMRRCKNMRLTESGKAVVRDGCAKINSTAIDTEIWLVEVEGSTRYTFAGEQIYSNESSVASGLTAAPWTAVQYNAFNDDTPTVFATNGTDRKRLAGGLPYEWGIAAPTVAPVLNVGSAGGLTGEYNCVYTYVRKVGNVIVAESNPSPAADMNIVLTDQSLAVDVEQPTDAQVTHIRLYRTLSSGLALYYFDLEVPANKTFDYGYTEAFEAAGAYLSGTGFKFTTEDTTNGTENTHVWEETFSDREDTETDENPYYWDGTGPVPQWLLDELSQLGL